MSIDRRNPFPEAPGIVRAKGEGESWWVYACAGCEAKLRVTLTREGIGPVKAQVARFRQVHAQCIQRGAA